MIHILSCLCHIPLLFGQNIWMAFYQSPFFETQFFMIFLKSESQEKAMTNAPEKIKGLDIGWGPRLVRLRPVGGGSQRGWA